MPITNRKTGLKQEARPSAIRTDLKSVDKGRVDFGTGDGTKTVKAGQTVLLAGGYANGGTAGSVYRRTKSAGDASINLGTENYSVTANWTLQGTNAAFTARTTANRDIILAVPDSAAPNETNVVQTVNP